MAPAIRSTELRLSYPLYALDFDPQDADCLVVGGGGGPARSGVGNKISVLDTSHEEALQIVSEIELSRDEDSVNTLAVGSRGNDSALLYAGINSAEEDLKKGKNEHFRVFAADLPTKDKTEPKIAELSRSALFSTTDPDTYQRLLRISGQIGAAATGTIGSSKASQIAVFDIPAATSASPSPRLRGKVELVKEATDMDLMQISDDEHQLVYCNDYDICTMIIGKTTSSGPHTIFTIPHDESSGAKHRPTFRCIRSLTADFVLAVANVPKAGGVVLQGYRLPKPSDLGKEGKEGKSRLAMSGHLPKSIPRATGLAVRNLSPPATPSAKQADTQFVIAVTGQDSSITLYTLEHQSIGDINLIANLHPVTTLKGVHLGPISGLTFSPFTPPTKPPSSSKEPLQLKLASIGSMGNTCVVHSLPIELLSSTTTTTTSNNKNNDDNNNNNNNKQPAASTTRYVLALKSLAPSGRSFFLGCALFAAFLALLLQGIMEVKGLSRTRVGARYVTPVRWHSPGLYYGLSEPSTTSPASPVYQHKRSSVAALGILLAAVGGGEGEGGGEGGKPVALKHVEEEGVVVRVVEDGDEEAKKWEALHPDQREAWKEALKKAGHWAEEMGETVFKGVLFGQIGGAVAAMVA
ncbi:hypothetical protein N658DRAFT_415509 [Parathielavia hyrcaniae]|uniref:Guanine nucleotide-exchange factor SEC12 n=1 Tax=Parathielavia hyrcaniae TaxID=113614 RepID=A0AAN6QFM4_9PEZI|nr:hypothetical protein N658DRAFT_415509 [Parathielavia hyrcaniae]